MISIMSGEDRYQYSETRAGYELTKIFLMFFLKRVIDVVTFAS